MVKILKYNNFIKENVEDKISKYGLDGEYWSELRKVLTECEPFIKDLEKCEIGTFLIRGVYKIDNEIEKFETNWDRYPKDTPIDIHNILNDEFENIIGWSVRNGVFCFKRLYKGYSINVGYGQESYILFPCGDYELCFNPSIDDLYSYIEGIEYDFDHSEEEWEELYGESSGKGEWIYKNKFIGSDMTRKEAMEKIIKNPEKFNLKEEDLDVYTIHDLIFQPNTDYDDYYDEKRQEYIHNEMVYELQKIVSNYDTSLMDDYYLPFGVEISVKCDDYYLVDLKYINILTEYIWEETI